MTDSFWWQAAVICLLISGRELWLLLTQQTMNELRAFARQFRDAAIIVLVLAVVTGGKGCAFSGSAGGCDPSPNGAICWGDE